ncbi:MAG: hypothetical protein HY543_06420 [Deltaproteobacteria bacterium]|nr:hypothetical protein [Deltaproteobacteria bacterium]
MRRRLAILPFVGSVFLAACSGSSLPFATLQQEVFETTPLTVVQEKVVRLVNPSDQEPQHIPAIGFDAGGNVGGHFQIVRVASAGRVYDLKNITVPAGATLEITVRYAPRDLKTTEATYAGWQTGQPERFEPTAPIPAAGPAAAMQSLLGQKAKGRLLRAAAQPQLAISSAKPPVLLRAAAQPHLAISSAIRPVLLRAAAQPQLATHRALVILTYDHPGEGVVQIELVGHAVPGPNGELTAPGGGGAPTEAGECEPGGTTACFTGQFAIDLPGLMSGGPVTADLSGPLPLTIDGSRVELQMSRFPPVLFIVKGNGPGEPLEGKPVGVISLVISGAPELVAMGSFDGAALDLGDVGFRVRIYLAEIAIEDADATTAPADFLVHGLTLTTTEPFADGAIRLRIETTLSDRPANDALIDPFLAGAKVIVELAGTLALP